MKIGNHILHNWENWLNTYVRAIYVGEQDIKYFKNYSYISGPIGHQQIRLTKSKNGWNPKFVNQLEFLQKIYDNEILDKNINFFNQEKTKLYIDDFLIKYIDRINNLIIFT